MCMYRNVYINYIHHYYISRTNVLIGYIMQVCILTYIQSSDMNSYRYICSKMDTFVMQYR